MVVISGVPSSLRERLIKETSNRGSQSSQLLPSAEELFTKIVARSKVKSTEKSELESAYNSTRWLSRDLFEKSKLASKIRKIGNPLKVKYECSILSLLNPNFFEDGQNQGAALEALERAGFIEITDRTYSYNSDKGVSIVSADIMITEEGQNYLTSKTPPL